MVGMKEGLAMQRRAFPTKVGRSAAVGLFGCILATSIWLGYEVSISEAAWYTDCPECKRRLGGAGRAGPFPTEEACKASLATLRAQNFPFGPCYSDGGSSSVGGGAFGGGDINSMLMQGMMQGMQGVLNNIFSSIGQDIANTLFGTTSGPGMNPEFERRRQEELERQQRAIQEELARQEEMKKELERKAREDFERERNRAYSLLKGPKPSFEPFGLKGTGDPAQLGLKDISPSRNQRDLSTQWKRLHCSMYLSQKAQAAAERGNEEDAKYLSEQAAQAMEGGTLGVRCPDAPAPPLGYGGLAGPQAAPQVEFYTALMKAVQVDLDKLTVTKKEIQDRRVKKEEAQRKVHEQQQEVMRLQQHASRGTQEQQREDRSVREEAEKLLREAEQNLDDATKGLEESVRRERDIVKGIQQKEDLYQRVQKHPEEAEALLSQVSK